MKSATGFLVAVTVFTALFVGTSTTYVESPSTGSRKNLVDEYSKEFIYNAIANCWEALDNSQRCTENALSKVDGGDECDTLEFALKWVIEVKETVAGQEKNLKAALADGSAGTLMKAAKILKEAKIETEVQFKAMKKYLEKNSGPLVNGIKPVFKASVQTNIFYGEVAIDMLLELAQASNSHFESTPTGSGKNLVDGCSKEFIYNAFANCWEALYICQRCTDSALSRPDIGDEVDIIETAHNFLMEVKAALADQEKNVKAAAADGTAETLIKTVKEMTEAKVETEAQFKKMKKVLEQNPGPLVNWIAPVFEATLQIGINQADVVGNLLSRLAQASK